MLISVNGNQSLTELFQTTPFSTVLCIVYYTFTINAFALIQIVNCLNLKEGKCSFFFYI